MRVATLAICAATLAPQAARAQFFWERPEFSPDDAARVAMQHGFRVIARPARNDDVYVAEVIDRRGGREQLIIAADSGRILQRFYVDGGRGYRPSVDPSIPPGPTPPARIPQDERHPGFFARLFGGHDDDADLGTDRTDRPFIEPDQRVRQPRVRRQPRVVEQMPETVHQTPVESAPLAPPSAAPSLPARIAPPRPAAARPPAEASLPPAASTPQTPAPSDHGGRARNPLAIPGSREQDEKAAVAAQPTRASAAPSQPSAAVKPVVSPKDPVAVAPLE